MRDRGHELGGEALEGTLPYFVRAKPEARAGRRAGVARGTLRAALRLRVTVDNGCDSLRRRVQADE